MKVALVIPAAGSGERLGAGVPKALVDCGGAPLVVRTLSRLASAATFVEAVVLAPASSLDDFVAALAAVDLRALGRVRVLVGGATRQESVSIGVAAVGADVDVVCVHDAARPLVDPDTVRGVLAAAAAHGAATCASRPSDSVREDTGDGRTVARDRARLWLVETPQAFRRELLTAAHEAARRESAAYTDDASLVEAAGHDVRIVASAGRNLKVTVEPDLRLAAQLLDGR